MWTYLGSGGHYFTHLTRLLGMLDIQSETGCLPEDALITGASSMSLASFNCFAFCFLLLCTLCFLANGLPLFHLSSSSQAHSSGWDSMFTSERDESICPWQAQKKNNFRAWVYKLFAKQAWETLPPNIVNRHSWHVCSLDAMQVKRVFIVVEIANLHVLCSSKYL